jgi:hypothetical protein
MFTIAIHEQVLHFAVGYIVVRSTQASHSVRADIQ